MFVNFEMFRFRESNITQIPLKERITHAHTQITKKYLLQHGNRSTELQYDQIC